MRLSSCTVKITTPPRARSATDTIQRSSLLGFMLSHRVMRFRLGHRQVARSTGCGFSPLRSVSHYTSTLSYAWIEITRPSDTCSTSPSTKNLCTKFRD